MAQLCDSSPNLCSDIPYVYSTPIPLTNTSHMLKPDRNVMENYVPLMEKAYFKIHDNVEDYNLVTGKTMKNWEW